MRWLAAVLVLPALVVIVADPFRCADGCTDEAAGVTQESTTCCALCQRSVQPAPIVRPAQHVSIRPADPASLGERVLVGWRRLVEHPPRA